MRAVRFGIFAGLTLLAAPLTAQETAAPWRLSYFPYVTASPNDGVMGIARAIWFRQASWGDRVTLNNSVAVEAGYSTKDAWLARVTWANPRLADGWRAMAHVEVGHSPNFGLRSSFSDDEFLFERNKKVAWIDVTRRLSGPLHLAVRPALQHNTLGLSLLGSTTEIEETDVSVRGALVLDLRDREFEVNNGILLEMGAIAGSASDDGDSRSYTAPYAHFRGWLRPTAPLRLTARYAWRGAAKNGLASSIEFPGWEAPFDMLGGHRSHRGLAISELPVDQVQFAGLEARFDIINLGELAAVTLFGFVDAGRVDDTDDLTITDAVVSPRLVSSANAVRSSAREGEWVVAPGGGIALRALRAATLTISAARAEGRTVWYVGSGWSW